MQELSLKVNTGAVKASVENELGRKIGEFEIIPTDTDIIARYEKVVDFFNHVEVPTDENDAKQVTRFELQIKEQFDHLFNYSVSKGIFAQCGPLTITQSGDFFFEQALEGIVRIIEKLTNERIEKKLNKVRAATAKYHKE